MTALSCRRRRLLNAARRLAHDVNVETNPMWRKLLDRRLKRLREEAAKL